MKLFGPTNPTCGCDADITMETTVQKVYRNPPYFVLAKQIHHWRKVDGARFWHWSDQDVVPTPRVSIPENVPLWAEEKIEPNPARNDLVSPSPCGRVP